MAAGNFGLGNDAALAEKVAGPPSPAVNQTLGTGAGARPMSGLKKAAIFILSLDDEIASEVLKNLPDPEAERITHEIAKLGMISREEMTGVIEEFAELSKVQEFIRAGGVDQAVKLIKRTFPPGTSQRLIQLVESQNQDAPFGFLKETGVESLYAFLQEEHPQTIALVLSYAERSKSAELLSRFPPDRQFDIVKRIANLRHSSPEAIQHVESGLLKHLSSLRVEQLQDIGGVKTVAEILHVLDRDTEKSILENLEVDSHDLVEEIKKLLFVFEDLVNVDDKGVQSLLKEVDTKQLALAMKSASPELKERIFKNMSPRAADMVKEEMVYLGPVRVVDVEAAQQEIADVVRRLEESGEVVVNRRTEGELIV